jgi:hypothetical protein
VFADRAGTAPAKRAAAALAAEVRRVSDARDQGRNTSLFQAAANLFEIVNTGWLDEGQVRAELTAAASAVGLGEREIQQTLDAQWRRKQGVTRPGWNSSGPSLDHLGTASNHDDARPRPVGPFPGLWSLRLGPGSPGRSLCLCGTYRLCSTSRPSIWSRS